MLVPILPFSVILPSPLSFTLFLSPFHYISLVFNLSTLHTICLLLHPFPFILSPVISSSLSRWSFPFFFSLSSPLSLSPSHLTSLTSYFPDFSFLFPIHAFVSPFAVLFYSLPIISSSLLHSSFVFFFPPSSPLSLSPIIMFYFCSLSPPSHSLPILSNILLYELPHSTIPPASCTFPFLSLIYLCSS